MTRILNFGSCNIDYVYGLDHIVSPGETEASSELRIFSGGKGLNQSIAVARAGGAVFHAGQVGEDGAMLLDIMAESGVDVSNVKTVNMRSGHAIIQVTADGENSIFLYSGANRALDEAFIEGVLDKFGADDILMLQNEINLVEKIIRKAHGRGMRIMLTPSPINDDMLKLDLGMISYLLLNETEAKALSGAEDAENGVAQLCGRYPDLKVVLTMGKNGCVYYSMGKRYYHPIFKVEAVDTTAAGDTFAGYFIAATADGVPPELAVKRASAAAALAVSRKGAAPSIPTLNEVLQAMRTLTLNKNTLDDKRQTEIILGYVTKNIRTARLTELAGILGYSKPYSGAVVKRLTGKPFSELLEDKRCEYAAELLADTALPIEEIIYRVGYANESFFRELFRKRYEKSPLEYRKNVAKSKTPLEAKK